MENTAHHFCHFSPPFKDVKKTSKWQGRSHDPPPEGYPSVGRVGRYPRFAPLHSLLMVVLCVEVDLLVIYQNFLHKYDGHLVSVTTSYKPLGTFYIKFDIQQLPHLLGLHKIYIGQKSKKILEKLASDSIVLSALKHNKNYGQIKDRVKYFSEIDAVLKLDANVQAIVISPADSQNSMRLDLVFQHVKSHRRLTLGLRRIQDNIFVPVTFLVRQDRNIDYPHSKRISYKVDAWY